VHVALRQLPRSDDTPPDKCRVELCVIDTGKVSTKHSHPVMDAFVIGTLYRVSAKTS
jgi:hypothetical protein